MFNLPDAQACDFAVCCEGCGKSIPALSSQCPIPGSSSTVSCAGSGEFNSGMASSVGGCRSGSRRSPSGRATPRRRALGHQPCAELKCDKNGEDREQEHLHRASVGEIANKNREGSMSLSGEEGLWNAAGMSPSGNPCSKGNSKSKPKELSGTRGSHPGWI